jgi:biotin transport system permease protein
VAVKLFVLLSVSLTVSLLRVWPVSGVALLLGALALCTLRPTRPVVRGLLTACCVVVPMFGYHLFTGNIAAAVVSALTFPTLIVWATLVSATTTVTQVMGLLERMLSRCGLRRYAARCALCVGITLRSIPIVHEVVQETIDVLRSRSVRPYPWRVFLPACIGVVRCALETGEAITARGLLDAP